MKDHTQLPLSDEGELVPRTPFRFLLADDPGAGKTIMAGT